jgi:hypothetical protein
MLLDEIKANLAAGKAPGTIFTTIVVPVLYATFYCVPVGPPPRAAPGPSLVAAATATG